MKNILEGNISAVESLVMGRRVISILIVFLVLVVAGAPSPLYADQPEFEIKLATLAPDNSSLMKIFNEMNVELLKETGGRVGFKMFSGFVLGDEEDVLRKLRIGLVHAATFTATALTDLNPDLRVMQVPFLFNNYEEVDYVLSKMENDFRQGFARQGYEILGWPELGFIYFMSTTPIHGLADLKGKKVWAKANAPMSQAIIDRSRVSTVAINAPDVLMGLQTNLLEVVYNSPYYALVTQWYTQTKYLTDLPLSYIGGALVIDKKKYNRLPKDLQAKMQKVCGRHLRRLTEKTRQDNDEALQVILKRGVQKITPSPGQIQEFRDLSDSAMGDMGPQLLPPDALGRVRAALAEYRAAHPGKQ